MKLTIHPGELTRPFFWANLGDAARPKRLLPNETSATVIGVFYRSITRKHDDGFAYLETEV